MRIAEILIEPEYPVKTAGEIVVENRVKQIAKTYGKKYEITILKRDDFNVGNAINAVFRTVQMRILRSIVVLFLGIISIPKINNSLKNFDIIMINGYFTAVFLLPYLVVNKKKTVYCPHTQVKPTWINAQLMGFFDAIVFLSDYNRQELISRNKKLVDKGVVIYNSINKINVGSKHRKSKEFKCLFVGRAVECKRPWLFIEGTALAWKKNKNIGATMVVATGPIKNQIKELINKTKKEIGFDVELKLNQNRWQVYKLYRESDVFILTSDHREGFGIVLLEAMANSLPIICTDHPKFREFLGDAALYFTDKESLASNILKLAADKILYKEYQKRSSQRFGMFSLEETTKKWVQLFDKISRT